MWMQIKMVDTHPYSKVLVVACIMSYALLSASGLAVSNIKSEGSVFLEIAHNWR